MLSLASQIEVLTDRLDQLHAKERGVGGECYPLFDSHFHLDRWCKPHIDTLERMWYRFNSEPGENFHAYATHDVGPRCGDGGSL